MVPNGTIHLKVVCNGRMTEDLFLGHNICIVWLFTLPVLLSKYYSSSSSLIMLFFPPGKTEELLLRAIMLAWFVNWTYLSLSV